MGFPASFTSCDRAMTHPSLFERRATGTPSSEGSKALARDVERGAVDEGDEAAGSGHGGGEWRPMIRGALRHPLCHPHATIPCS